MKKNKLMFILVALVVPGFVLLFTFQNCSPAQFSELSQEKLLSSELPLDMSCEDGESLSCRTDHGDGIRECNLERAEFDEGCQLIKCDSGYQPVDGKCLPSACSNGAINSPLCDACGVENEFMKGQCIVRFCEQAETKDCFVQNGQGQKTCNLDGTGFGLCEVENCNQGYHAENNKCVSDLECANGAANYPQCDECKYETNYDGSKCVKHYCDPGYEQSCLIANGEGVQKCNANGTEYGECILTKCKKGYAQSGNICIKE